MIAVGMALLVYVVRNGYLRRTLRLLRFVVAVVVIATAVAGYLFIVSAVFDFTAECGIHGPG